MDRALIIARERINRRAKELRAAFMGGGEAFVPVRQGVSNASSGPFDPPPGNPAGK
jgi:hypothetical protein